MQTKKNHVQNVFENISFDGKITVEKILPILDALKKEKNFTVKKIGTSVEKRPVFSISFGNGRKKILAWTQMHGDEPTSTLAFLDFLIFLSKKENHEYANRIFSKLSIVFIPILNPDGAAKNIRYNALGIDVNRDALTKISPESKILWKEFEKFRPRFALNLHDQTCHYSAGNSRQPVWLSFLATVSGAEKTKTTARKKAMSVIGQTVENLKKHGIKNLARYSDEYEPRAFGDNFAKRKCSVILIEAGCAEKNERKIFERRIFFDALLQLFESILTNKTEERFIETYEKLPENKERMLDLILNDVKITGKYRVQIGIKNGLVEAVGDLSTYGAFEYIDTGGLFTAKTVSPGKKANIEFIDKDGKIRLSLVKGKIGTK